MATWMPSFWGRVFGGGTDWTIDVGDDGFRLTIDPGAATVGCSWDRDIPVLVGDQGHWPTITIGSDPVTTLRGLPRRKAGQLQAALADCRRAWMDDQQLRDEFTATATVIGQWYLDLQTAMTQRQGRWLTREFALEWTGRRPASTDRVEQVLTAPRMTGFLNSRPKATTQAIDWWRCDLQARIDQRNESFLAAETTRFADFFRTVESSPLTGEQIRAVVCLDNRVQVVAAAGSGKTSTMIAKAGYVLTRRVLPGDQILMLAFNTKAADELRDRVRARLRRTGIDADQVTAQTFHAFGLSVIGLATGRKPRLTRGLDEGNGEQVVQRLVDELRDTNPAFRTQWDLFRLVYGRAVPPFEEEPDPEVWDPATGRRGFRTMQGEVVKSHDERMVADWLFYNGVTYRYEPDYPHRTADTTHGQYRPDFYYPHIDTYHEHWALNAAGQAPPHFEGYLDGVRWKRQTHAANRTRLLETTSASVRDGTAFDYLAGELIRLGVRFDPDPYRAAKGRPPLSDADLVHLVRTFMIHVKSNRLSRADLKDRAAHMPGGSSFRTGMFLRLFDRIYRAWDQRLADAEEIDFEDMLNLAADHIEAGRWVSPYRLVMVDEMQDASRARSRLARALVSGPGHHLFAVGDDWQSINRFAGADLSAMTAFHEWFGEGPTVRLQQTFRSPQSICNLTGAFVTANPTQLPKQVRSDRPEFPPAFRAVAVSTPNQYVSVIDRELRALSGRIGGGTVPPGRDDQATVYILGRYNRLRGEVKPVLNRTYPHLKVGFSTIHSSKGREADYVVLPGLVRGGLPSMVEDDPLLGLAMPAGDDYPHAEERRLLYVALTRARRSVLMLTVAGRESPFLMELLRDGGVTLESADGKPIEVIICPNCGEGRMIVKTGRFGDFLRCNNFPRCTGKMNITPATGARPGRR